MKLYHLYTVTPRLLLFIEQLTEWYLRLNKKRLKGEECIDEWDESLTTLFVVILSMIKLMVSLHSKLFVFVFICLCLLVIFHTFYNRVYVSKYEVSNRCS